MKSGFSVRKLLQNIAETYGKRYWNLSFSTKLWLNKLSFKNRLMRKLQPLLRRLYASYFEKITSQKVLINNLDFDVLVIYDACRLDYFSMLYPRYFEGSLQSALSAGSMTLEWLINTWYRDHYEVAYVSATPLVKSGRPILGFNAEEKFMYVDDVWNWGWSDSLTTVPPEKVNIAARLTTTKLGMKGLRLGEHYKLVIHYVQPHAPYLCLSRVSKKISESDIRETLEDIDAHKFGIVGEGKPTLDFLLLALLKEITGSENKLIEYLRMLYQSNLDLVMRASCPLIRHFLKKGYDVVISADHGELLGEYGLFFHPRLHLPYLRIVPWFQVRSIRK